MQNCREFIKEDKFEFNTYCICKQEENDIADILAQIFKDYLENTRRSDGTNYK